MESYFHCDAHNVLDVLEYRKNRFGADSVIDRFATSRPDPNAKNDTDSWRTFPSQRKSEGTIAAPFR